MVAERSICDKCGEYEEDCVCPKYLYQFETIGQLINEVQQQGFTVSREEWTQEPPTEPGWYWCYSFGELTSVEVLDDGRELYASSNGKKDWLTNWSCECWWQKMVVPDPPEVKVEDVKVEFTVNGVAVFPEEIKP